MSENIKDMIFFAAAITIFFILGQSYRQFRSFRMKRLATKYGLSYSKNFVLFYPDTKKFNTISGFINNKKITIYDSVSRKSYGASVGSGIYAYQTIIQIEDIQIKTKPKRFTGIKSIRNEILKCV